jgi:tetratricopeptide (TPR) repeat protein
MPSVTDRQFIIPVWVAGPISVLPRRLLRLSFPVAAPLLRAIGPGEQADDSIWSTWLSEWGWAWAVTPERCAPAIPLVNLWLERSAWPVGFDARALALAVALKLRVDGEPLSDQRDMTVDLDRVWRAVSALPPDLLGEILALALLRADAAIFHFDSVAPQWPSDVGRVVSERRSLIDEREPTPVWLRTGYALLGDTFAMLRSMGTTYDECQEVWESFTKGHEPPWAFEMAFWWEATYCLTERHAYEDAERTQARVADLASQLEALTGLIDPMWHHQQGRLYYYAGNHETALAEFLREFQSHGDDLKVAAMLGREIANVLSDLACLDGARTFAERSVTVARNQGQKSELYKSLGRLAEIAIKLGDLDAAEQFLEESREIQERMADDNRSPAQTLTYLGHVALLKGEQAKAGDWYALATNKDRDKSSLPYIIMGQFALAVSQGDAVGLDQLWIRHRAQIDQWGLHETHILPAAVCTIAASVRSRRAMQELPKVVRLLMDNRYAVEAIYTLKWLPSDASKLVARDILSMLTRWRKTLASLPPDFQKSAGSFRRLDQAVEGVRHWVNHDKWNLDELIGICYPMTLIPFNRTPDGRFA